MNPKLEAVWKRMPARVRRVRLKRRRTRQHIPRPKRTAKELADYLRQRNIRTTGQLRKRRAPTDPTVGDYIKVYGRWSEAIRQTYGEPPLKLQPRVSRQAVTDMVVQLDIRTRDGYVKAHKKLPELVPTWHQAKRLFASWSDIFEEAAKRSAEIALGKYVSLAVRLRRTPHFSDIQRYKIDLTPLRRGFKTKRQLDSFLAAVGSTEGENLPKNGQPKDMLPSLARMTWVRQ